MTMLMRRLGFWNVALAVAAAAALIIEAEVRAKGSLSAAAFPLALVAAAPLAWRTRAPLAALVCVGIGVLAFAALFPRV